MKRYQILYSKMGLPMVVWKKNVDDARQVADMLRASGYTVTVFAHTKDGAEKTTI